MADPLQDRHALALAQFPTRRIAQGLCLILHLVQLLDHRQHRRRTHYPQPRIRLDLWGGSSGSYSGLDRFGRIVDQHWTNSAGTTTLDRFAYGYDRNSSRTWKQNPHQGFPSCGP